MKPGDKETGRHDVATLLAMIGPRVTLRRQAGKAIPMPSSASHSSNTLASATVAIGPIEPRGPAAPQFGVVPFRRTADGTIVPGAAVPVSNGDIAWRFAQAAAFDHDKVGAVALTGTDLSNPDVIGGVLLASFGQVNLDALRH